MSSPNTQPEIQRLFFALWPDEETREQVWRLSARVDGRTGKRVARENLHITLNFLGSVTEAQRLCVEGSADRVRGTPFTLILDRLGYWRRPKVLWLSGQSPPPLLDLVRQLNGCLPGCGLAQEDRPFQAHLTLMRKVRRAPQPIEVPPIPWGVGGFVLVRSDTRPEGVRYEVLRRWPLDLPAA